MSTEDRTLLEAALIGYRHQAEQLAEKIAHIRRQLGGKMSVMSAALPVRRHTMSEAARKRIAAAQKKRWAEFHRLRAAKA